MVQTEITFSMKIATEKACDRTLTDPFEIGRAYVHSSAAAAVRVVAFTRAAALRRSQLLIRLEIEKLDGNILVPVDSCQIGQRIADRRLRFLSPSERCNCDRSFCEILRIFIVEQFEHLHTLQSLAMNKITAKRKTIISELRGARPENELSLSPPALFIDIEFDKRNEEKCKFSRVFSILVVIRTVFVLHFLLRLNLEAFCSFYLMISFRKLERESYFVYHLPKNSLGRATNLLASSGVDLKRQ